MMATQSCDRDRTAGIERQDEPLLGSRSLQSESAEELVWARRHLGKLGQRAVQPRVPGVISPDAQPASGIAQIVTRAVT
jgi:hypothetical protein